MINRDEMSALKTVLTLILVIFLDLVFTLVILPKGIYQRKDGRYEARAVIAGIKIQLYT